MLSSEKRKVMRVSTKSVAPASSGTRQSTAAAAAVRMVLLTFAPTLLVRSTSLGQSRRTGWTARICRGMWLDDPLRQWRENDIAKRALELGEDLPLVLGRVELDRPRCRQPRREGRGVGGEREPVHCIHTTGPALEGQGPLLILV